MEKYLLPTVFITALALIILSTNACTSDMLPEPMADTICDSIGAVYQSQQMDETQVIEIIDFTCAVVGCHLPGGIGPGNFSSYDGMLPYLEDGTFRERVIDMKDDPEFGMPPNYSTSGPTDLTPEELQIIECWLDTGFPQN